MSITSTLNLGLRKEKDSILYFANLSTNSIREFFYRMLWKKNLRPKYFFDGINKEYEIENIDHLSFHRDGEIHFKYSDIKKSGEIHIQKLRGSPEKLKSNFYLPLLAISIYDVDKFTKHIGWRYPLHFKEKPNINYYWELKNNNRFSLVLFLLGSSINPKLFLEKKFKGYFNISMSPLLMNYFGEENRVKVDKSGQILEVNDLGLLVGFTNKVIPQSFPDQVLSQRQKMEFKKIDLDLFGIRLFPNEEGINAFIG